MWLFTIYGHFSVVCARGTKGQVDPNMLMVRSRDRQALYKLKRRFSLKQPVREFEGTDYQFRIFLPKETFADVAAALVEQLDYDNFKGAVQARATEAEYLATLYKVYDAAGGAERWANPGTISKTPTETTH
jgi:hypothetical protein